MCHLSGVAWVCGTDRRTDHGDRQADEFADGGASTTRRANRRLALAARDQGVYEFDYRTMASRSLDIYGEFIGTNWHSAAVPALWAARLRVLHVHSGNMYGGVETVLVTLARLRRCPEMESSFALCFDGRLSEELTAAGGAFIGWAGFDSAGLGRSGTQDGDCGICSNGNASMSQYGCWSYALFAATCRRGKWRWYSGHFDIPNGTHWLERKASRISPNLVLANSRFTASAVQTVRECNGSGSVSDRSIEHA